MYKRQVLASSPAAGERAARDLAAAGWRVRPGWSVAGTWDLRARRLVLHGPVREVEDGRAAVLAAARGAGVVAVVDPASPAVPRLFEDLSRLGTVELREDEPEPDEPRLDADQRAILELVAQGATLPETARRLSFSLRTVNRRLALAREELGARTTAEAVARLRRFERG